MATENAQLSTTTGGLLNSVRAHLAKETLPIAMMHVRFAQLGDKLNLGGGNGKTWTATRYKRVTLPTTALTEGTTPDGSALTTEQVTGTAEEWGAYITLTDVAQLTLFHPVIQKTTELLGKNAAETYDREVQDVIEATTSINYGDAVSGRASVTATGVLGTEEILKAVAQLRANGATEFDGQNYVGVLDPMVEADVIVDTKFIAAANYSNVKALFAGEIGQWMGVRWIRSNFIRKIYGFGILTSGTYCTTGATGALRTGTYEVQWVGRDVNGLHTSITKSDPIVVGTSGVCIDFVVPDSPTGYLWDLYWVRGTGGTPLLSATNTSRTGAATGAITGQTSVADTGGTGQTACPVAPTTGVTIHNVYIFGKGAFGVIDLMGIQRTLTTAEETDSDPLGQRRKTGYKFMAKAVILNEDFMKKIEVASAYDA